jgi:hypothetical protein
VKKVVWPIDFRAGKAYGTMSIFIALEVSPSRIPAVPQLLYLEAAGSSLLFPQENHTWYDARQGRWNVESL